MTPGARTRPRSRVPVDPQIVRRARTAVETDERFGLMAEELANAPSDASGRPFGEVRAKAIVTDLIVNLELRIAEDVGQPMTRGAARLNGLRAELHGILQDVGRTLDARFEVHPDVTMANLRKALQPDRLPQLLDEIDAADRAFRKAAAPEAVRRAIDEGRGGLSTLDLDLDLTRDDADLGAGLFDTPEQAAADVSDVSDVDAVIRETKNKRRALVRAGKPTDAIDKELEELATAKGEAAAEKAEIEFGPAPPTMSEQDRVRRTAKWEARLGELANPDLAAIQADATAWGQRALPPDTAVTVVRNPHHTQADLAAFENLAEVDPHFVAVGYELKITLPDGGPTFQPDAIEFRGGRGRRYRFHENKEIYRLESAFYLSDPGKAKLREMLHKHAGIANRLRGRMEGWIYTTGVDDLDIFLRDEILDMQDLGVAGADLLIAGPKGPVE